MLRRAVFAHATCSSVLLRKQMEANLYGVVDVTLAVLPHMRERKAGTIVVVGSRSAYKTELIVGSPLLS